MNLIQQEVVRIPNAFDEVSFEGRSIVRITRHNVDMAEMMIHYDSAYRKTADPDAGPLFKRNHEMKYRGSSTYWMIQLKKYVITHEKTDYSYEDIIKYVVESLDSENSTHINSDNMGREVIEHRIVHFGVDRMLEGLKNPDGLELFDIIQQNTGKESQEKGRHNPSFASKFCHYACMHLFDGTRYQDNYPIYDNVICSVLPLYQRYYGTKKHTFSIYTQTPDDRIPGLYREYTAEIDEIIEKSGAGISRNAFDHLLWYYHKARMYENEYHVASRDENMDELKRII